jgi:hypothetical protein
VTFAFPRAGVGLGEGFGLAEGATGSAAFAVLAVLAEGLLFASAASFVPAKAKTGAINAATSSELQSHLFKFINFVVLLNREPFIEIDKGDNFLPKGPLLHL